MFFPSYFGASRRMLSTQVLFAMIRLGNERGIALILSLVILILISILGALVLNTSSTELRIVGNATSTQMAFYCGDAGVAFATNPNQLTTAYNNALASGNVFVAQSYGPVTLGSCNFNGNITYLSTGQLANVEGRVYDQNVSLDSANNLTQRFRGLYFIVESRGQDSGNTFVPLQTGVQQVVGN